MKKAAPGRAGCPAPEQSSGGDIWITAVPLLSRCQTSFSFGKVKQFQAFPSRPAPHRLRWHPSAGPAPRWGGVPAPPPERHPQRPPSCSHALPQQHGATRSCGAGSPLAPCRAIAASGYPQPSVCVPPPAQPGGSAQTAAPSPVTLHLKQPYK